MLGPSKPQKAGAKEKRPPLTHFLCFPLVTESSLPVLEKSFSHFRDNIPLRRKALADHPSKPRPPLFPDSAVRPLGTLHLTLGVMSLTSRDRVDEAIQFLESLDIEQILREISNDNSGSNPSSSSAEASTDDCLAPISVSLESLYALPRAKAATVLYAKPVDRTSRLYPLGIKLRERFVEAGFVQPDYLKPKPRKPSRLSNRSAKNANSAHNDTSLACPAEEATVEKEEELPKPKLRPLLLHATVVNTIYARNGHTHGHSAQNKGKDRRRAGPLTFDARDLLAHHHDFYTDDTCTEVKRHDTFDDTFLEEAEASSSSGSESNDESNSVSTQDEAHPSRTVQQITPEEKTTTETSKYPFIWARNVHIEKVCICEMGAKTVVDEDGDPLGTRLGQKYRVVAEKRLPSFRDV